MGGSLLGQKLESDRGEDLHGGRERPSALADAFEALWALFFSMVVRGAREFILRSFKALLASCRYSHTRKPQRRVAGVLQSVSSEAPHVPRRFGYGPDHDRGLNVGASRGCRTGPVVMAKAKRPLKASRPGSADPVA